MSLPPILNAAFTYVPERGKGPLKVSFDDGSTGYDAIEQTGSAPETIIESGSETDYIRQE